MRRRRGERIFEKDVENLSLLHWQTQKEKQKAMLVEVRKNYNKMYKFGQIEIASKEFNSVY